MTQRLAVGLALVACSRASDRVPDDQLAGLVRAPRPPAASTALSPAEVSQRSSLDDVLARPWPITPAALGAHRVETTLETVVVTAQGTTRLNERAVLDVATPVAWHGTYENSGDNGRETIFADAMLRLRSRYAKWHRRPPTRGEPEALLATYQDMPLAAWDLVGYALAPSPASAGTHLGRPTLDVTLGLDAKVSPPTSPLPQHAWRNQRQVTQAMGILRFDQATGALVAAELVATVRYPASQGKGADELRLKLARNLTARPNAELTLPPTDQEVDTPVRSHEAQDEAELLNGLTSRARQEPPR